MVVLAGIFMITGSINSNVAPVSYTHLDVYKRQALYGVNLRYKKPLYAAMIGGGVGGLICGLFGVKAYVCLLYTSRCV